MQEEGVFLLRPPSWKRLISVASLLFSEEGFRESSQRDVAKVASGGSAPLEGDPSLLFFLAPQRGCTILRIEYNMPSSWTQNIYHAVFSTKHRVEILNPSHEDRLYPFVGGILKELRCTPIAINGMADHIHVLTAYPSDLSHSDMLWAIKQRSSTWIHDTFPELKGFEWQVGYGGFTVSKSMQDIVAAYIRNQKEHHKTVTSLDEFKEFLRVNEIEYNPKYLE